MTFTRDDRTLLGDDPVKVARAMHGYGRGRAGGQLFGRAESATAHP